MIWNALKAKLRNRGPGGLAYDSMELAVGCIVVGVYSLALGTAAIGGVVVGGVIGARMWVAELAEYKER